MSKAAANMAGQLLALELSPLGIPVTLIHPGAVLTDMYHECEFLFSQKTEYFTVNMNVCCSGYMWSMCCSFAWAGEGWGGTHVAALAGCLGCS